MATNAPITVSSGQVVVDTSVIPFIRKKAVEFTASDLKPGKEAKFFFDETTVDRFVQRPSILTASETTNLGLLRGERLYNATTGAYATIVDQTPTGNAFYLNENFLSVNIAGTGLSTTSYARGDIVWQNNTNTGAVNAASNTFTATVEYWDSTRTILVLSVQSGNLIANNTQANTLFKVPSTSATSNVRSIVGNTSIKRFDAGQTVASIDTPTTTFTVSTYSHYSGQIAHSRSTLSSVNVSSNVSTVGGSVHYLNITSGAGVGQQRLITSVTNGNQINFSTPLSVAPNSTSTYSVTNLTVDAYGKLSGIFNIPEDPLMKFRTGERLFTITDASVSDDQDAQMKATAKYVAAGLLNTRQEVRFTPVVPPTPPAPIPVITPQPPVTITPAQPVPVIPRRRRDPVAQTFFTPEPKSIKQNYGIFVTSVDIFFKSKPSSSDGAAQLPVTVRLVTTVNGFPTQQIIAYASRYPSEVNTTDGVNTLPDSTNSSTYTRFTFGDPVYLEPSTEYALVVFSESPDYEVWISELGQNILGTNRRVSEQPYAGSFFRSQNASAWTPFQNQDLMFVINKAVFSTSPATLVFNVVPPLANTNMDEVLLHATDTTFPVANMTYKLLTTVDSSSTLDSSYFEVTPNKLYNFGTDLKTSSVSNKRRRKVVAGDKNSLNVEINLLSTDPDVSPIFNAERLSAVAVENLINNGSLTSNNVTITNGGGQHTVNTGITVTISAPTMSNGITATAVVLNSQIVSGNITGVFVTNGGAGYIQSPTITIADTAVASPYSNATAVVTSENSSFGGNSTARYITRRITLADGFDAGDLRLYLRAVRPAGTNIFAYYKVLSAEDSSNFFDKNWQLMQVVKDNYSLDQESEVELQFRPNLFSGKLSYVENNVEYPLGGKFKNFAIKLVLLAEDPSVVPYVKNMRAIATPEG